jgi:hypothetical protein
VFVRFCPFGGEGWWRFGAGAGRVLVGATDGGTDRDIPVDLARGVDRGLDLLEQTLPRSVGRPQPVTLIDALAAAGMQPVAALGRPP